MDHTPSSPPDPVRTSRCPRKIMVLAAGGYRVTWDCGAVKVTGAGSGEWPLTVDLDLLEENIDRHHAHRHHPYIPHRTKVTLRG